MKLSIGHCAHVSIKARRLVTVGLALACCLLLSLLSATAAFAAPSDWPTYLSDPARSANNTGETTLNTGNAASLTRLWNFKTGGVVASSATVVGGVVYVGSWDGNEYALNAATGKLVWKTFLGITSTNQAGCSPSTAGVSSAAAVQGGVVYVGGGDRYWYALDATRGTVLWKVDTGDNSPNGGHYNWSSPLIYNGFAYIGVASLGDCPLVQGQLLKVDLSSHQVTGHFNVVPQPEVGGGIWTSPSIDASTNTIFVTTGTEAFYAQQYVLSLIALDATTMAVKGSWKIPKNEAAVDSDWGTTPTLVNAGATHLVAAINKNGFAYAFNRGNVSAGPVWQRRVANGGVCPTCGDGSVSSGATGGGRLYLAGGSTTIGGTNFMGAVRALDPATGGFRWEHGTSQPVIAALAYANGLVIAGAGTTLEVLDAASGNRLYSFQTGGTIYGAPSVSGGQIFAGSVDGSLYAFGLASGPPPPSCPAGWSCADVGAPAVAGGQSLTGTAWTVTGAGNDIWGTSDQFHFVWKQLPGNGSVRARVVSQQNTFPWAKSGVMLRQSTAPGSAYYAALVTPGHGIVVQYRTAQGAVAAMATSITGAPPAYLRVSVAGASFSTYTSADGVNWTLVTASTRSISMPGPLLAGMAVCSHQAGVAGQSVFDHVAVG